MKKSIFILLLTIGTITNYGQSIGGADPDGECGCKCAYYKEVTTFYPVIVFGVVVHVFKKTELKRFEYNC